jgi:multiple antibiotic resistance protein
MITGTSKPEADAPASQTEGEVGIVPLGIPLLAGPGLISTAIIQSQEVESIADNLVMTALALLTAVYVWAWLAASDRIVRRLGTTGLEIVTKVSGLILVALTILPS